MTERRINIAEPSVGDEEWDATREVFASGWLTQGSRVAEFESRFAARHRVPAAIATTSCTTALHVALVAAGIGPGDEVIVPAFTWVATANAVRYVGADPVFADVDPCTYNVTPEAVASAMTARTRGVVPVHLFGLCADVDGIADVVGDDVFVLEDAACAAGAAVDQRPAGSLGDAAAFSFHPRKIITTGEGGMVTTTDAALAERMRRLRNHGASVPEEVRHHGPRPYVLPDFDELGFNFRMTDIQGAVGCAQMERLDSLLERRRELAARYHEELEAIDWLRAPRVPAGFLHSWQSYVCVMADDTNQPRNDVMEQLELQGVSTRPGTHAPPLLGLYRRDGAETTFPVASMLEHQSIALPLHNQMTDDDVDYLFETLRGI